MAREQGAVIAGVKQGGLADQAGVCKGDVLLAVDGQRPRDFIEYRYLIATDAVSLRFRRPGRNAITVHIEKEPDEDLGIRFDSDVFDQVMVCRCRCEFCFVAQLPAGLRPALYLRDDDYRLSFLHGNFITLTNLTEADFQRILRFHLSPLWVSVHATEPGVRSELMGCKDAADIPAQLRRLAEGGIELHTQVVVCPGRNDGAVLARTVQELGALHPAVLSIGVVPAGINRLLATKGELYPVGLAQAREILDKVHQWQREFLSRVGTRLVWAADEMYLTAGREFPPAAEYEEFYQQENGIGEARKFLDELAAPAFRQAVSGKSPRGGGARVTLTTGAAASGLVAQMARRLCQLGIEAEVVVAINRLLGPAVTSASLIGGADWLAALGERPASELVILPKRALNADGLFLDDLSRKEFVRQLGCAVGFARTPLEAAAIIGKFCAGAPLETGSAVEQTEAVSASD